MEGKRKGGSKGKGGWWEGGTESGVGQEEGKEGKEGEREGGGGR